MKENKKLSTQNIGSYPVRIYFIEKQIGEFITNSSAIQYMLKNSKFKIKYNKCLKTKGYSGKREMIPDTSRDQQK